MTWLFSGVFSDFESLSFYSLCKIEVKRLIFRRGWEVSQGTLLLHSCRAALFSTDSPPLHGRAMGLVEPYLSPTDLHQLRLSCRDSSDDPRWLSTLRDLEQRSWARIRTRVLLWSSTAGFFQLLWLYYLGNRWQEPAPGSAQNAAYWPEGEFVRCEFAWLDTSLAALHLSLVWHVDLMHEPLGSREDGFEPRQRHLPPSLNVWFAWTMLLCITGEFLEYVADDPEVKLCRAWCAWTLCASWSLFFLKAGQIIANSTGSP